MQGEYLCGQCHLRSVTNWPPGCTFHPSLIAFISDALQGSWLGADKGQLDPFTQLHSLVGESGQFCQTARGKGMPPPDQRPAKVCVSLR